MKLSEYQAATARPEMSESVAMASILTGEGKALLLKNALGLCGEAGEASELIKKHVFHDRPLDLEKLEKELGDVFWYLSQLASAAGLTLDAIAATNVAKLLARYPDGYSKEAALARADEKSLLPGDRGYAAAVEAVLGPAIAPRFCEHPNECPLTCPCRPGCGYCKEAGK